MSTRLLILTAFIAVAVVRGRESDMQTAKSPGFVYLGSIAKQTGISTSEESFDRNNYYASTGSTTWTQANQQCNRLFGGQGGLVAIESEFENTELAKLLEHISAAGSYWTGGIYHPRRKVFVWTTTETQLPTGQGWSYNPWASGEPTSFPTSQTRTLLNQRGQKPEWLTAYSTMNKRYICEVI